MVYHASAWEFYGSAVIALLFIGVLLGDGKK